MGVLEPFGAPKIDLGQRQEEIYDFVLPLLASDRLHPLPYVDGKIVRVVVADAPDAVADVAVAVAEFGEHNIAGERPASGSRKEQNFRLFYFHTTRDRILN